MAAQGQEGDTRVVLGDALFIKATNLQSKGRHLEAASLYEKAILLDDHNADYQSNYGAVLEDLGRLGDAELAYRKALELNNEHASALFNLAMLLQSRDTGLKEAEVLYRRLLSTEPDGGGFDTLANLASVLHQQGKLAEAVKLYDKAASAFAWSEESGKAEQERVLASVYEHLGRALLRLRDQTGDENFAKRAVLALRASVDIDPDNSVAAHMLASQQMELGGGDSESESEGEGQGSGGGSQVVAAGSVAPAGYVRKVFDDYAATFETSLSSLGYRAPQIVAELLGRLLLEGLDGGGGSVDGNSNGNGNSNSNSRLADHFGVVVDLGCGTGLLPPALGIASSPQQESPSLSSSSGGEWGLSPVLVGVDLSPGMLAQAETKGVYAHLYIGEVTRFLLLIAAHLEGQCRVNDDMSTEEGMGSMRRKMHGSIVKDIAQVDLGRAEGGFVEGASDSPNRAVFDSTFQITAETVKQPILFAAVDVLCYIGDLGGFFEALARCMRRGDMAVFTVESADVGDVAHAGAVIVGEESAEKATTAAAAAAVPTLRDWTLRPSGRYAHRRAYIEKLARLHGDKVQITALEAIAARQELGKAVGGYVVSLRGL